MRNKFVLLPESPNQTYKTVSLEATEDVRRKHTRFICNSVLHTSSAGQRANGQLLFPWYFTCLLDAHFEMIIYYINL